MTKNATARIAARITATPAIASTCCVTRRGGRHLVIDSHHEATREAIRKIAAHFGGTVTTDATIPDRLLIEAAR